MRDESRPFAGMTEEEIHEDLLRQGITEHELEKAHARVFKALDEARIRFELDDVAEKLGFGDSGEVPPC